MNPNDPGDYRSEVRVQEYLSRADRLPHRSEGETVLLELLQGDLRRVLDIGCGDGRLLSLVLAAHPEALGVGMDFSPPMLAAARLRFTGDARVVFVEHDLHQPLPDMGRFDAVVSSFAIHHLPDERKHGVYREIFACLHPGGFFCNLEHVASPSLELHEEFYWAIGVPPSEEDPSNQLSGTEPQLAWLRAIGYHKVDCYWKWREFALLAGKSPNPPASHPSGM
jgi:tRNA (cmo5U34)-methyltransferase